METAGPILDLLEVPNGVPIITRDMVAHAKPDPDLFLAAGEKLGIGGLGALVVGDSVWDMLAARRAGMLGIGLLSGGYGRTLVSRPVAAGFAAVAPVLGTWSLAFGVWYAASAWSLAPYPF